MRLRKLMLIAMFLFPLACYSSGNEVFISGKLINNTNTWFDQERQWNLYFQYVSGYLPEMKNIYLKPNSNGRFAFIEAVGNESIIDLNYSHNGVTSKICEITISAIDTGHAVIDIQQLSNPNLSCQYQGNPDNDTAVITINGVVS